MDALTAAYLTNLAAELSALVAPPVARRLRERWLGTPSEEALTRCLEAGILGMTSKAALDEPAHEVLLADIFRDFFTEPAVARELSRVVRLQPLDVEELQFLFGEAGYDAATLPGLRFDAAVAAFEAAFLEAATLEPALQPVIQVHQGWAQTDLQREMVALMRQMVLALRQAPNQPVGIQAGTLVAEHVVSGTQVIYQWPAGQVLPRQHAWEQHYLRTLLTYCDALDLAAIDELHAPARESAVHVSDVFTTLYLARGGRPITCRPEQSVEEAVLQPHAARPDAMARGEEAEGEPVTAVAAAAALDRLVILGYPGGGKSTLVNYLAAQMARRRLGRTSDAGALPGWPADAALLPVRIILRHFAANLPEHPEPGPQGGLVWNYLEQHLLPQWGCQEVFDELKQTLTEAGGLVLFDGLDEVPASADDGRRSLIKAAIADFAAPLTQCKVIVTCREYAYKAGDAWRLPEQDFPVVDLALFAPEQIRQFTETWYRHTGPFKGWDAQRCQREAQRLYEATQQWLHLRELAQYPLLLTLMAQVHGRDGYLPEDRADLYERAVNLLLAHWENRLERETAEGRQVEPGLIVQLGVRTETLKGALARVAFEAHEAQERAPAREDRAADITRDALWEALHPVLGSYDRARLVTDYVQFRAGLLQARDRLTYTFPHRTFQEYLAALHVWKLENPGEALAAHVKRDLTWWREVFLLAAGHVKSTPTNVVDLVDWLLPADAGEHVSSAQAALATLAGQALRETDFPRQAPPAQGDHRFTVALQRIKGWLQAAMLAEATVPAVARAEAGLILGGMRWRDGRLLDDRPGVGFMVRDGMRIPDIVWGSEVPAGTYPIGGDRAAYQSFDAREVEIGRPYRLARYPITHAQFQCFVEASDFDDARWWKDMPPEEEAYGTRYRLRELSEQAFEFWNHPRERVSWYQALAFCRWLSDKLEQEIDLPHEYEWEAAARYADGRRYPWGDVFDEDQANTLEGRIAQTTAVGIYPAGRQPDLELYDLSGNVWEWCRNKYDRPEETAVDASGDRRVVRGGSWSDFQFGARAACRYYLHPGSRSVNYGFRVVVRRPPSDDH